MQVRILIWLSLFAILVCITSVDFSYAQVVEVSTTVTEDLVKGNDESSDPLKSYSTMIGIIIASITIAFSAFFTIKALKSSKRKTEADLFLRLNETIYRSEDAKSIINAIVSERPILKINGGDIESRILENFLNEVQAVCILINHNVLSPEFAEPGFVWVLTHVKKNPEIMAYIDHAQKTNYGYYSWGEISKYKPKEFERRIKYDNEIGFKNKFQLDKDSNWVTLYNKYFERYSKNTQTVDSQKQPK